MQRRCQHATRLPEQSQSRRQSQREPKATAKAKSSKLCAELQKYAKVSQVSSKEGGGGGGAGRGMAAAARLIEVPRCQVAAVGVAVEIVVSGLPTN